MFTDHLQVLTLFSVCKEVEQKKLQKLVYIAKYFGAPFNERFHYQRHGPYSAELFVRLEELSNLRFLEERIEQSFPTYQLTHQGQLFLETFEHATSSNSFYPLYHALNAQHQPQLELMAAMIYFDQRIHCDGTISDQPFARRYSDREWAEAKSYLHMLKEEHLSYYRS